MRFTVQHERHSITTLCEPDGTTIYRIESSYSDAGKKGTQISRVTPAGTTEAIAMIQKNRLRSDKIVLKGGLRGTGHFDSRGTITLWDGMIYKWKVRHKQLHLVTEDGLQTAATYERPSTLVVAPDGDDIMDEIIISFASINGKRRGKREEGPLGQIGSMLGSVGDLLGALRN